MTIKYNYDGSVDRSGWDGRGRYCAPFSHREVTELADALNEAHRKLAAAGRDSVRLDWIESVINEGRNDRIEIAKSLFRGGYEFGWWRDGTPRHFIGHGTLRAAIDAALYPQEPKR